MAHTSRCADATNGRCKCSCQHAFHGATSGRLSSVQIYRAKSPTLTDTGLPDQWPNEPASRHTSSASARAVQAARLKNFDKQLAAASKLLAAGFVNGDMTQELSDAAAHALMAHDGVRGRRAANAAMREFEFHVFCTLFWMAHQTVSGLQDAITWTVGEFLEAALVLPERPRSVRDAVVTGVKDAFAEHLASEATSVFLNHVGVPDADQLRLLAVGFCPNSGDHREIRELEKEMSEAALGAAINHVMQAADDDPDDRGSAS